jgi:transcriptional regulator with XRE-family HTH domain
MESGKWMRSLREERFIKPSDVERITRKIAEQKNNADFYVSHSTLADIESGSVPSIHKLFSLALCLGLPLHDLFLPFGIDTEEALMTDSASEKAITPGSPALVVEPAFRFQLNFDVNYSHRKTNLLRISAHDLESVPSFLRGRVDPIRFRYAVIGLEDDAMMDILPPRSIIEVDTAQNTVQVFPWRTLRERPLYLVWHSEGHTCCWCQMDGRELTIIPHPLSQQPLRRFKTPGQASVLGRVTNAWSPFQLL